MLQTLSGSVQLIVFAFRSKICACDRMGKGKVSTFGFKQKSLSFLNPKLCVHQDWNLALDLHTAPFDKQLAGYVPVILALLVLYTIVQSLTILLYSAIKVIVKVE